MAKPLVSSYLSSFSEKEKKDFGLFIGSPLYNRDKSLIKLYTYILKNANTFSKNGAYKYVFENKTFKEQRINNMMTQLVHLAQDFLSHSALRESNSSKKEFLIRSLRKKKNTKLFENVFNDVFTRYESQKTKNSLLYQSLYTVSSEADALMMETGLREKNTELQTASDNLDLFYFTEKLRITCEMLNRRNIIGAEYDKGASDAAIQYIEANIEHYKLHPAILIYHCIFLTLKHDSDDRYFSELKKLLKDHAHTFTKEEARHMYEFAENYCIKKVNTGNIDYLIQIHSIYEELLASNLILNEGVLSESDYKNIIAIALRLGKHDWTLNFIEYYQKFLPEQQQQNAYTYNIASYYYTTKDYKNAVRMLRNVEFTDVFYHLGSKLILLKIYYENEEIESFYSLIDSFKVYLFRNKKISAYQRESYSNLVRFCKKCFDLKVNPPLSQATYKARLDKINKKVAENKNVVSLIWLKEQLGSLQL